MAATAVKPVPNVLQQAILSHQFFHQGAQALQQQFLSYHTVKQNQFFLLVLTVTSLIFHTNMVLTPEVYSLYKNGKLMLQKWLNLVI